MTTPSERELAVLWQLHQAAPWPALGGYNEGELMTLDTVISGCVVYALESEDGLDRQRRDLVRGCLHELDENRVNLPEEAREYFARLSRLATLLLAPPPTS